ncbi:hypothetical protein ES319_D07G133300v1 [Gossypium barbadense]|uniref:Uncharacterized protein n=2 Tax=Gossypium TaxID=3633 RepID=A0A5J5QQC4_GOSBA|nr:hypothetical protein ES319_D07G133300v1 [Gossypium barbadense]TYH62730.1 hypothetical protein ES332_D07G140200v1 [Gossypium tomentosum]
MKAPAAQYVANWRRRTRAVAQHERGRAWLLHRWELDAARVLVLFLV